MTVKFTQILPNGERHEITKDTRRKPSGFRIPAEYFNLGLYICLPILVSIYIGHRLDIYWQTTPIYTAIGITFGTISMFYNLYKLYKNDGSTHKH